MRESALQFLRTALNDPQATFRDGQWESIERLLDRQRMLVVQRTGWGKSMVYFLATKLLREQGKGPTLLISPLLSLMRNQLEAAGRIGISAQTINSSNTDEWQSIEQDLRYPQNVLQMRISDKMFYLMLQHVSVCSLLMRLIVYQTGGTISDLIIDE